MISSQSLYINNQWVQGHGKSLSSYNPASDTIVWEGATADANDVNNAVEAAKKAFPSWASTLFETRAEFLQKFKKLIQREKENLATTLSLENGKPLWEALNEIQSMCNKIDISIEAHKSRSSTKRLTSGNKQYITRHLPHGVIAVFGPFNFPAHLPNGHFIPALLAGNTIVFKPSELTPLISEKIFHLWEEVALPSGVINLVQGEVSTGQLLADHPGIDGLFFTGSWKTGSLLTQMFSHKAGKILVLEMGGNNPLIITSVDDLQAAAYTTIHSAYLTSGQRCTCARRLILPLGQEGDRFLEALIKMIQTLKIGPYTDSPEPFMGPVISKSTAERLLAAQETLKAQGGISLLEMNPMNKGSSFLSPGLMDVTPIQNRQDEEYFGPFLQVIRVKNFDEAIREAQNTAYGLTAGLLSNEVNEFHRFSKEIKAGIHCWNSPTTGIEGIFPFGGTGKSGNFRPTALYATDYCTYPATSIEIASPQLPEHPSPGIYP